MQPTALGIILAVALAACFVRWHRGFPWILCAAAAVPSSAAVLIGGQAISPFYAVAALALVLAVTHALAVSSATRRRAPGQTSLALFALWCTFITLVGPSLFRGSDVLTPRAGIDSQVVEPGELGYSISNAAQVIYLWLGVAVVMYVAQRAWLSPKALGFPLALATVLSSFRLLTEYFGVPWPGALFDNSPNVIYIDATPTGDFRLRGVFAEPSLLAGFSMATVAYFASTTSRETGHKKLLHLFVVGLALLNLSASYSGTAVVAGAIVLGLAAVVAIGRTLRGRALAPLATILSMLFLAGLPWLGPPVVERAASLVEGKLLSSSYVSRTSADLLSLQIAADTFGLGTGLGSNRPSTLLPMLLSCVGIVGTVLFLLTVVAVIRHAWMREEWRAAAWVLLTILITKSVAGPDLSDPMLWLSLAFCCQAAWTTFPPRRENGRALRSAMGQSNSRRTGGKPATLRSTR